MELLAIIAVLNLLALLNLSGKVITDCLGIVTTLKTRSALKRQLSKPGASLLLSSFRSPTANRTLLNQKPSGTLQDPTIRMDPRTLGDLPLGRTDATH